MPSFSDALLDRYGKVLARTGSSNMHEVRVAAKILAGMEDKHPGITAAFTSRASHKAPGGIPRGEGQGESPKASEAPLGRFWNMFQSLAAAGMVPPPEDVLGKAVDLGLAHLKPLLYGDPERDPEEPVMHDQDCQELAEELLDDLGYFDAQITSDDDDDDPDLDPDEESMVYLDLAIPFEAWQLSPEVVLRWFAEQFERAAEKLEGLTPDEVGREYANDGENENDEG